MNLPLSLSGRGLTVGSDVRRPTADVLPAGIQVPFPWEESVDDDGRRQIYCRPDHDFIGSRSMAEGRCMCVHFMESNALKLLCSI